MRVGSAFRNSMGWLHSWAGIGLSALMLVIFWMGSLSVFDREIDAWMIPELRIAEAERAPLDTGLLPWIASQDIALGSEIFVSLPVDRSPAIKVYYENEDGAEREAWLHPATGERLDVTDSLGGTGFFYPFHYSLHVDWRGVGIWIVGFAAMAMLALIVSGIFIHRKIVQDFFTFRPRKNVRRFLLDMHNLTGLAALPFHVMLPFTGLLIFASIYLPWSIGVPFDDGVAAYEDAAFGAFDVELAGTPGPPFRSVDGFIARAEAYWSVRDDGEPARADILIIRNHGDANAYVRVERYFPARKVALGPEHVTFDADTGNVLARFEPEGARSAAGWLEGLHFIQFDHWPLRWLYFVAGLSGCVMIASGLLFWIQVRVKRTWIEPSGIRVVRAMTVGSTTGVIIASGAFLIANRLLPKGLSIAGYARADLEVWAFFLFWVMAFGHAAVRGQQAWQDQAWAIAAIGLTAPLLNWITTGQHVLRTIDEELWSVAGTDLVLLSGALIAMATAMRFKRPRDAGADGGRLRVSPAKEAAE